MSVFAVNEILSAEEKARSIKESSAAHCKAILAKADQDGEALLPDAEKAALQEARAIKADCEKKLQALKAAADAETAKKAEALKKSAEVKMPAAIKYITEHIN